jgi:RND superfamily putative drug exporter
MITDEFRNTVHGLQIIDTVTPQIIDQIQAVVTNLQQTQSLTLTLQSTLHSLISQLDPLHSAAGRHGAGI